MLFEEGLFYRVYELILLINHVWIFDMFLICIKEKNKTLEKKIL